MKKSMENIEHHEQAAFFQMSRAFYDRFPELSVLLFAIPNGGHRRVATAGRMQAEGVRAGIPDICCAMPSCGYHALYIEMKKPEGGVVSDEQERAMSWLARAGNLAVVARGRQEAFDVLSLYLDGKIREGIGERIEASELARGRPRGRGRARREGTPARS